MNHRLLTEDELTPEIQKVLGSGPSKMMAAKGISPLSNPKDVLTLLYQLSLAEDEKIKESASKTMETLPANILDAGLSDPTTHSLVLDKYSKTCSKKEVLIQKIILNHSTDHQTIEKLAGHVKSALCDLIAGNEERLLNTPSIIASLYSNKNARMSTVDRAVELAIRNGKDVKEIPAWEELKKTFLDSGKEQDESELPDEAKDDLFEKAQAESENRLSKDRRDEPEEEEDKINIRDMTIPMKIRLSILGNSFDRAVLVQDAKKMVAMAAIKSPAVSDTEAGKYATNQSLCEDVITYISSRRDWVKLYGTKLSLVNNPKTPIAISMNLMKHLRAKDIRTISRSKGIPSALATQAKRLLRAKAGGNKKK